MLRALSTVGGFTMMSRILGLVREIFMAAFLGTGIVTDAFYAALRLPNMFRRIFGEGAFNSAFVPLFGRDLAEGNIETAHRFARNAFSWLGGILLIATVILIPGMPWFAKVLVPLAGPETFELVVAYARIMFSYLLCMALSAHLSGVLNSMRIFAMPAFAPVLLNVLMLLVLGVVVPMAHLQGNLEEIGRLVSWSVCTAGFAQLALLWVTCWRKGVRLYPVKPTMSPRIRRLGRLMGPGVLAAGIQQINLVIGTAIASSQESAIGSLNYADRLFQMPNGMIGAAFGVVLLPEITRLLRTQDELGANDAVGKGVLFSMLLTLPAAVAFVCTPQAFVGPIYERLEFTSEDTLHVSRTLAAFAVGLPAYVLVKVLQAGYFARENTKSPMFIAGATVAVNVIASLVLFRFYGFVGIAIATSIAGWVNVLLLVIGLRGKMGLGPKRRGQLVRTFFAAAAMGAVVWFADLGMESWFDGAQWQRIVAMLLLVGVGFSAYALLALALKATSITELKAGFRR
ncbi:murein biosynthesis integral membrane protein MurJ [Haloferula rosea]|uniref:Probable lipid II flippase MurJ n=1 Tax=Haloferula rosea TaxID=490093 RepID=A0A934VAU6_9BACT|nr:murein biosynthesis integral membrane protein MurJ [Haloferula rosea]MBK1826698.1 murein biosynthesis integral membrane protein MurJ [Haloferula rosea]